MTIDPAAIPVLLLGLFLAIWPQKFTGLILRGLEWQRRNIPDPSVGLQERIVRSRITRWFLRIVGAMMVLGFVLGATENSA